MVKLAIAGAIGAFLLFYIITSPNQAADLADGTWAAVVNIAHGIGKFLDKLVS